MRREAWGVACCPVSPCKARTTISFSNFRYSFSYRFHILLENQEEKKWSSGLSSLKQSYQRYTRSDSCHWFSSSRDYSYTPWQTVRKSPLKCSFTSLTSPIGFNFLRSLEFALGVMFAEKE